MQKVSNIYSNELQDLSLVATQIKKKMPGRIENIQ